MTAGLDDNADRTRHGANAAGRRPLILHVPFTFFPEASGGTEVYVRSLANRLAERGYACAIACPGPAASETMHEGLSVHRFATDPRQGLRHAYGAPDEIAARGFRDIVARLSPAVVHLHARTAAVSERLIDVVHEAGARVVFTYHTPTVSCARGTMLLHGREPCDGGIDRRRCLSCTLEARGVPVLLAAAAARIPAGLTRRLGSLEALQWPLSGLRIPGLIGEAHERFRRIMANADHIVAVCDWVAAVLSRNGVPAEKLSVSRQGIDDAGHRSAPRPGVRTPGRMRIAYFGRLDPTKGADLVADALALLPDACIEADLYLVRQPGCEGELARIEEQSRRDHRIHIKPAVAPNRVRDAMADYDLIAVPSRWLETGPLVVLEAFSAGVPVSGARRGGIAELVRDGVDGLLFAPGDAASLAAALRRCVAEPDLIDHLRAGIRQPRTMRDAADDMAALYARLLGRARGVADAHSDEAAATTVPAASGGQRDAVRR